MNNLQYLTKKRLLKHSFQARNCIFDALHCFYDIVITCRIAHTEALGVAECIAPDCGYMAYFQQV
jgi:hypothetical protein